MDHHYFEQILEDFSVYVALIRKRGTPHGMAVSGGCYDADHFNWSRIKGVKVHYDQNFQPRKMENSELGVTFRVTPQD